MDHPGLSAAPGAALPLLSDADRRHKDVRAERGRLLDEEPKPLIYPLIGRWLQCAPVGVVGAGGRCLAPPARSGHSLVAVEANRLLLFGGGPDENVSNEVYRIDLSGPPGARTAACTYLHPDARFPSPFERDRHSAWAWHGHMYIFGGEDVHGYMYSDIWHFDHNALVWTEKVKQGASPSPRRGQTCTLVGDTVWLFGGLTFKRESVAEVYTLNMTTCTFKLQPTQGVPPCGRRGHSATVLGGYIYIFGGCDEREELLGDLWRLELATCTWEQVLPYRPHEGPAPSVGHAAAVFRGKLLTFGGNISSVRRASCSEIWLYDAEQKKWKQLKMKSEPKARSYHTLVAHPDGDVLAFGGWSGFNSMNDMMSVTDGCNGSLRAFMAECILKHNIAYKPPRLRSPSPSMLDAAAPEASDISLCFTAAEETSASLATAASSSTSTPAPPDDLAHDVALSLAALAIHQPHDDGQPGSAP